MTATERTAYYNENDPKAAAWLRELIKAGAIAPGKVDERDIRDVRPSELEGFIQCHFFAGIGVWSYALRLAGWGDSEPVWTGSCPCQPFSAAGKGGGFADERHLWPAWFHLIEERRPSVIFGEQVASPDGLAWLDLVQTDLEATGHTFGPVDLCAAGIGAPHIRQRLYWVAEPNSGECNRRPVASRGDLLDGAHSRRTESNGCITADREAGELADSNGGYTGTEGLQRSGQQRQQPQDGFALQLGNTSGPGLEGRPSECGDDGAQQPSIERTGGAVRGFWSDAEWIYCTDEKYRPVEPGTFPLAHGAPARVGRLRGYGNAIVAGQAAAFIAAYREVGV